MKKSFLYFLMVPFLSLLITGCEKDASEEQIPLPSIKVSTIPENGVVEFGEPITFLLQVENATKMTLNDQVISIQNKITISDMTESDCFNFVVENSKGKKASALKCITVAQQHFDPPVFLSLTADPDTLPIGGGIGIYPKITWTTQGADKVYFDGVDYPPNPNGPLTIYDQIPRDTTFVFTAVGPGGQVSQSITITVTQPTPMEVLISSYSWRPWKMESSLNIDGPYEFPLFFEDPCCLDDRYIFENYPRIAKNIMGDNLCDPDSQDWEGYNWRIENENHLTMPDRYITKLDSDTLIWISVGLRMIDSLTAVQCFFRETMISEPLP